MALLFTVQEWAQARRGLRDVHALLAPRSESYEKEQLIRAARRIPVRDEDGRILRYRQELVTEPGKDEGLPPEPVRLTVQLVEPIDVYATEPTAGGRALTLEDARACGRRTVDALRDAWREQHRRSDFAQLIWFVFGDARDRDLFMNWTGQAGGDYTRNARRAMDSDAPALSPEEYDNLGIIARQADLARTAERYRPEESEAERIARIERAGAEAVRRAQAHFALIAQRIYPYEQILRRDS